MMDGAKDARQARTLGSARILAYQTGRGGTSTEGARHDPMTILNDRLRHVPLQSGEFGATGSGLKLQSIYIYIYRPISSQDFPNCLPPKFCKKTIKVILHPQIYYLFHEMLCSCETEAGDKTGIV